MKEATGEASMTGITIAIIAVVAVIAVPLVQSLVQNMAKRSCCANLGGTLKNGECVVNGSKVDNWWDSDKKQCKE